MPNPKTLGPNPRPNARPLSSVNQRPAPAAPVKQQGSAISYGSRPVQSSVQQTAPARNVNPYGPKPQAVPASSAGRATQAMRQGAPVPKEVDPRARQQKKDAAASELVTMLRDMVGGFAILSEETLSRNLKLMSGDGFTYEDRTITFECADYVISNLAYIFMGLVLDANFKDSFKEALNVEMQIDSKDAKTKAEIRKQMKDPKQYKSTGSVVLGVTTFVPAIRNELMGKMQAGFNKLDAFADEFDAEVAKMPTESKVELGFIFSNFMYLIRAFTHNDLFMSYVITVIEKVKGITSGK